MAWEDALISVLIGVFLAYLLMYQIPEVLEPMVRLSERFRKPSQNGVSKFATVLSSFEYGSEQGQLRGKVRYHGEVWNAWASTNTTTELTCGSRVRVIEQDGLTLRVERADTSNTG